MHTLDEIVAKVQEETTLVASLKTFIAGLKQQITDALANENLSAETQAKIDGVFEQVSANDVAISEAMAANTPQAE